MEMSMKLTLYLAVFLLLVGSARTCWRSKWWSKEVTEVNCNGIGQFSKSPSYKHMQLPECSVSNTVGMTLYRSGRIDSITRQKIPPDWDGSKRTIFLVHGWKKKPESRWPERYRDLLNAKGDYNIIIVKWGSNTNYAEATANTRVVGAVIALTAKLMLNAGTPASNLWCIGHSLGAHTCGEAGKRGQFGRITGLDPAGKNYETYNCGLTKTDASFVDVIHTNYLTTWVSETWVGIGKPLGHVDFYPNGGDKWQPGCYLEDAGCSHARAHQYFEESIHSTCTFSTLDECTKFKQIPRELCHRCFGCQRMGFHADEYTGRGMYHLITQESYPYCRI